MLTEPIKHARMMARISEVQKLRQKSHPNISEISLGDLAISSFRIPVLLMNNIANAAPKATVTKQKISSI